MNKAEVARCIKVIFNLWDGAQEGTIDGAQNDIDIVINNIGVSPEDMTLCGEDHLIPLIKLLPHTEKSIKPAQLATAYGDSTGFFLSMIAAYRVVCIYNSVKENNGLFIHYVRDNHKFKRILLKNGKNPEVTEIMKLSLTIIKAGRSHLANGTEFKTIFDE